MVVAFARDAESDLEQYDMWRMAYIHWPSIPWKRSALAFLPSLVAKVSQAWEHISVLAAVERYDSTSLPCSSELSPSWRTADTTKILCLTTIKAR